MKKTGIDSHDFIPVFVLKKLYWVYKIGTKKEEKAEKTAEIVTDVGFRMLTYVFVRKLILFYMENFI